MDERIAEEDIAALTAKLAESAGAARVLQAKLDGIEGPLAVIASLHVQSVGDQIDTLLTHVAESSALLLSAGSS